MSKAIDDARAMLLARREALLAEVADIDRAIESLPASQAGRRRGKGSIGPRPQEGTAGRIRAFLVSQPGAAASDVARGIGKEGSNVAATLHVDLKRGRVRRARGEDGVWRWFLVTPEELLLNANLLDPLWEARVARARRYYEVAERDAAEYAKTVENSEAAE